MNPIRVIVVGPSSAAVLSLLDGLGALGRQVAQALADAERAILRQLEEAKLARLLERLPPVEDRLLEVLEPPRMFSAEHWVPIHRRRGRWPSRTRVWGGYGSQTWGFPFGLPYALPAPRLELEELVPRPCRRRLLPTTRSSGRRAHLARVRRRQELRT